MPLADPSLSAGVVPAAILIFADFADMPLRYAYAPFPLFVPPALPDADADCAGHLFETVDPAIVQLGVVEHGEEGSQTLSVTMLATATAPDLLNAIEDQARYVGRLFRVWLVLHDGAGQVTAISPDLGYTGYMGVPSQQGESDAMTITMEIENYMAVFGRAPSRTYLIQGRFDPLDLSSNVTIAQGGHAPAIVGGSPGAFGDGMNVHLV